MGSFNAPFNCSDRDSVFRTMESLVSNLMRLGVPIHILNGWEMRISEFDLNSPDILFRLKVWEKVSRETLESAELSKSNNVAFLSHSLNAFGLRARDNLVTDISNDEELIIELFHEGGEVIRSFSFFDICSYNIVDLLFRDWTDLWVRNPFTLKRLEEFVGRVLGGEHIKYFEANVQTHIIQERDSPLKLELEYKFIETAPLYDLSDAQFKRPKGFVVVLRCKDVSSCDKSPESEKISQLGQPGAMPL